MLGKKTFQISILLLLLIGFVVTSSSALAFWRELTVPKEVEVISIGEPVELIITDLSTNEESNQLVPEGYAISVGEVEEITLEYSVGVSRELLNSVDLYVNVESILIGDLDTYSHLINIDLLGNGDNVVLDLYNDTITITVTVSLIEPIDEAEAIERGLDLELVNVEDSELAFNQIKGQNISFVLGFELRNKEQLPE